MRRMVHQALATPKHRGRRNLSLSARYYSAQLRMEFLVYVSFLPLPPRVPGYLFQCIINPKSQHDAGTWQAKPHYRGKAWINGQHVLQECRVPTSGQRVADAENRAGPASDRRHFPGVCRRLAKVATLPIWVIIQADCLLLLFCLFLHVYQRHQTMKKTCMPNVWIWIENGLPLMTHVHQVAE